MFCFSHRFADRLRPLGAVGPRAVALLLIASMAMLAGCSRQPVAFSGNEVFAATIAHETGQPMEAALEDVEAILVELFGTPNNPRLPQLSSDHDSLTALVDPERLTRASGPVASDRDGTHRGLFREHCSVCHGITGDGLGPAAALQNPYPRDYRKGVFKYKSTPRGARPTRQDITRTVVHGLRGTSMPAFASLPEEDLEAIVDYVIYLSIRGELERRLLIAAGSEFDYSSDPHADSGRLMRRAQRHRDEQGYAAQREWIESEIDEIVRRWSIAPSQVGVVASQPSDEDGAVVLTSVSAGGTSLEESIAIGRELFRGQIANCSSCHGDDGAGGAGAGRSLPLDYDDWTKEWTTRLGIDPKDREKLKPFRAAGALRPRPLEPRNLTLGGFRGGETPRDVYLRIVHGIDGTPMPAINRVDSESETGLTDDQLWHLVNYVLSLSEQPPALGAVH